MALATARNARSQAEALVLAYARSEPELGQFRVADALRERGVRISPSGVRSIWKRHQLETLYKRISALSGSDAPGKARLSGVQQARFKRAERRLQLLKTG